MNTIDLFWHPIRLYSDQAATASTHDDTSRAAGHTFCTHALCADEDMHGWYTIAISQLVIAMHVLHMYVCAIFPDACIYRSQCTTWSKYANKGTSICGTWESGGMNSSTFIFFLKIIVDLCETSFYASDLPYRRNLSGSSRLSNIFSMWKKLVVLENCSLQMRLPHNLE